MIASTLEPAKCLHYEGGASELSDDSFRLPQSCIEEAARGPLRDLRRGRQGAPSAQQALDETARYHRTLILTAKELPAHAGNTSPTTKAAQDWLARTRKNPRTAIDVLHDGVRGFRLTAAQIRRNQPRARKETCLVLIREGECPRVVIEAAHGALREYRPSVDLTPKEIFGRPGK